MLHWSTKDCQEDAEIGKFRNLILPTDRNCPWGENRVTPTSVTLDLANKIIKPWYTAWWIFPSHTLVQLLYNSYLQDLIWVEWSHQFTSLRSGCPLQGTMITLIWVPGSYLHHWFQIQCQWSYDHYDLVLCSACGTRVWMWIHARAVTVTEEYWYHLRL